VSGGFQVVLRLADPLARDDSGLVRFGHTGPSLRAKRAIRWFR
jgi:hypothetical protein